MKKFIPIFLSVALLFSLAACGNKAEETPQTDAQDDAVQDMPVTDTSETKIDGVKINLSDDGITVDGEPISTSADADVYAANDIVFYLEGQGFTYGEGEASDEHSQEEADAHTVVHITKAGTYILRGVLSSGQIAVDLGEDAEDDPNAVVTLVLDSANITCTVAPAVIFYNVYECGNKDNATMDVDTSAAGANVIIADSSRNSITGSHVARIYKEYTLSDDGTEVTDSKKLHKYDAAFYSKMSMNIDGESNNAGQLIITADNEGLDTEMHLTINGGQIVIYSGNDGINTNEDGVSVTTINGGTVSINVTGETGEGDGIDSNGWLVINGGAVSANACGFSGDSGIDADNGVYINGGTVFAFGNMLDELRGDGTYAVFAFSERQKGFSSYILKDSDGEAVLSAYATNDFTYMVLSANYLLPGEYTLWQGDTQLGAAMGEFGGTKGGMGGMQPPDGEVSEMPEGEAPQMPNGAAPEIPQRERPEMPEGEMPQSPDGQAPEDFDGRTPGGFGNMPEGDAVSNIFTITKGANFFSNVSPWVE